MLGLGLTSFAALLLELALTRLFSVVLFYHFAFLAISIALLGLGAGGVFAYLLKKRLARTDTRTLAARLCMVNSVLVLLVLEIVLHVPVALDGDGREFSAPDGSLPRRGGAFFPDWIAVLGCLCARDLARSAALRSGFEWRSAGLPGRGSAAQLDWRAEYDSGGGCGDGCGWPGLGRILKRAQGGRWARRCCSSC